MTAPTPASTELCDPKCRCPNGPYANQAFQCDDPCAGQSGSCTFDCQNGCSCDTGCVSICTVTEVVDGVIDVPGNPSSGYPCSNEYCDDPVIVVNYSPFTGINPYGISIPFFYTPERCGFRSRGVLVDYTFPVFCNGDVDNLPRSYSTTQYGVNTQARRADVYVTPFPLPEGCIGPIAGRVSDGAGVIPDCFTLVVSAVNPETDRLLC
jgi:hypothetical protein